jgi:hypothetical protein
MLKGFGWGSWAGKGRASLYNAFKAIIRMIPVYGQEVEQAVRPGFVLLYSKKRLIHMNRFFGVHLLYRFSGNVVG